jgi:hypothetical protein
MNEADRQTRRYGSQGSARPPRAGARGSRRQSGRATEAEGCQQGQANAFAEAFLHGQPHNPNIVKTLVTDMMEILNS